jgi:hypothetical protein
MLLIKAYGSDWMGTIPAIRDVEKAKSLGMTDDDRFASVVYDGGVYNNYGATRSRA